MSQIERIDDSCFTEGLISEICDRCSHRKTAEHRKCNAFVGKIPLDIWQGRNNHSEPYLGDNGKLFVARVFEVITEG